MRLPVLMALLLAGCRTPADTAPSDAADMGPRARVATFNVRRFFDTVCDSNDCGDGDDYEVQPAPDAFAARADEIAAAIIQLDADVISLQEVETQACLDALLARLPSHHGVLGETGGTATVDVAVLSRSPIANVIGHRMTEPLNLPDGTTTVFSRELLEVHIQLQPATTLVMFAAHFKSKSSDEPARRLAEAQVSTRIVNERAAASPDALVVLAGDLNDVPGSPPIDAMTIEGGLIRVADDLPVSQQSTYVFNGRGQAIDHVLLAPTGSAARVPRSSRVWRSTNGWGGSDHAALTSELYLPE